METLADELAEDTEQFTVELSAPLGATVADGVGEGTISDDDDAPELSIDDAPAVSEGETAEFTVRLSEASGAAVSVSYRTVDGTAVAGRDYAATEGTLRYEPVSGRRPRRFPRRRWPTGWRRMSSGSRWS